MKIGIDPMFCTNVVTRETMYFSSEVSPRYAVAYGYCEENNLLSWFFNLVRESPDTWEESFRFQEGKFTVSVNDSDWVAPTKDCRVA